MKPGRELDALIAEKVMGEQVVINKSGYRGGYYYSIGPAEWYDNAGSIKLSNPLPPYSEDIAAAWRVVDKLTKDFTVRLEVSPILNQVIVEIDCPGKDWIAVDADTAPHAICLAALRIAEHVWKYGSDEWSKGYALGVRGYIADEPGIAEEPSDPRYHGLNGWEPETE